MTDPISYKEEIIKLLDNLSEREIEGLYWVLQAASEMDEEDEEEDDERNELFQDERPITDLTVDELGVFIYDVIQMAVTDALMDFNMMDLSDEDFEMMDDFFEAFQQFLEEGNFEDDVDDDDGEFEEEE